MTFNQNSPLKLFIFILFVIAVYVLQHIGVKQYDLRHDQEFVVVVNPNAKLKKDFDIKKEAAKVGTVVEKINGLNGYRVVSDKNKVSSMALDAGVTVEPVIKFSKPKPISKKSESWFGFSCDRKPTPSPAPAPVPAPSPAPEPGNQPDQVYDWGVKRVNAAASNGTEGVRVCVLDTGIDKNHPDLKFESGKNFTTSDINDFQDRDGHGSHTAGLVAAQDNKIGVRGASQASLLIGKVLGDDGSGYNDWIAAGINWCVTQGADIISMSLGGPSPSNAILNALKNATSQGVLVFAAAGNDGTNQVGYPAGYIMKNLFSISATDTDDSLAYFSNFGKVEMAAPGVDIYSTVVGGYDTYSGTSMATPIAAGIGALSVALGVPMQFDVLSDPTRFGAGIPNAQKIVDYYEAHKNK